jgi:hypothetical protein
MISFMIIAKDPADLLIQVTENLAAERDLYTPLFVSTEGLLVQRMVRTLCVYDYRLIIAQDLDDLYNQERNMMALDFDYLFNTVMWNGKYLQWMQRMNNAGLTVKNAVVKLAEKDVTPAQRVDELQLVESVRDALQLEPISEKASLVTIPFPVHLS